MTTKEKQKAKKDKDEMVARFEKEGRKWGAKLDEISAKLAKTSTDAKEDAKAEYHKGVADLKSKYEAAQKKLAEFTSASGGKWDNFKGDMETLWKDIEITFKGLVH